MERTGVVDMVFYVVALMGVGLWSIFVLGVGGFKPGGIPFAPEKIARGVWGRVFGTLLILIGATFVVLSVAGAWRLYVGTPEF